jgi:hypothetical protein
VGCTREKTGRDSYRNYASSVMIAKNSCSLISPSWSRSNSSIIACLGNGRGPEVSKYGTRNGETNQLFWEIAVSKIRHCNGRVITPPCAETGYWAQVLRSYALSWTTDMITYNSSSSRRSPISFATLLRFRRLILPVLSSSNNWKARRISSIGSRASIRSLTGIRSE